MVLERFSRLLVECSDFYFWSDGYVAPSQVTLEESVGGRRARRIPTRSLFSGY